MSKKNNDIGFWIVMGAAAWLLKNKKKGRKEIDEGINKGKFYKSVDSGSTSIEASACYICGHKAIGKCHYCHNFFCSFHGSIDGMYPECDDCADDY